MSVLEWNEIIFESMDLAGKKENSTSDGHDDWNMVYPKTMLLGDSISAYNFNGASIVSAVGKGGELAVTFPSGASFYVGENVKISGLGPEISKTFRVKSWAAPVMTVDSDFEGTAARQYAYTPTCTRFTKGNGYAQYALSTFKKNGEPQVPFNIINTATASGSNTTDMLARMDYELLPYNPELVIFMGGMNDASISNEETLANIMAIHDKLKANNIKMIIMAITPVGSGTASPAWRMGKIFAINAALAAWCAENKVPFIDSCTPMLDDTGYADPALMGDNIHPNEYGHEIIGRELLKHLEQYFTGVNTLPLEFDAASNLLTNGLFMSVDLYAVNGVTGRVPKGSNVVNGTNGSKTTGVSSVNEISDGCNSWDIDYTFTQEGAVKIHQYAAYNRNYTVEDDGFLFAEALLEIEQLNGGACLTSIGMQPTINGNPAFRLIMSGANATMRDGMFYARSLGAPVQAGDLIQHLNINLNNTAKSAAGGVRVKVGQLRAWVEPG